MPEKTPGGTTKQQDLNGRIVMAEKERYDTNVGTALKVTCHWP